MKPHTNETNISELGERVRSLRLARTLGLRALARAAGVDPTWLSRLEAGRYSSPDARALGRVARALDVDAEELLLAAGYSDGHGLPGFAPYLRAKYELPDEAVAQLEAHFQLMSDKYAPPQGGSDE